MSEQQPISSERAPEESAFAERIKTLREELGWSQSDLAERMNAQGLGYVSQSTISRIEKQTRPIQLGEALAFGRVFERSIEELTHPSFGVAMLRVQRNGADQLATIVDAFESSAVHAALAKMEGEEARQAVDSADFDFDNPEVQRNVSAIRRALDFVRDTDLAEVVRASVGEAERMYGRGSRIRMTGENPEVYQTDPT